VGKVKDDRVGGGEGEHAFSRGRKEICKRG